MTSVRGYVKMKMGELPVLTVQLTTAQGSLTPKHHAKTNAHLTQHASQSKWRALAPTITALCSPRRLLQRPTLGRLLSAMVQLRSRERSSISQEKAGNAGRSITTRHLRIQHTPEDNFMENG
jgi:hypothetical protein